MRDFFKGWRRKVGVVLLVLACGLHTAHTRSLFILDRVCIPIRNDVHAFISFDGEIGWVLVREARLFMGSSALSWKSEAVPHHFGIATKPKPSRMIPYWFVTLPLTLLSAYLILWKPRKRV